MSDPIIEASTSGWIADHREQYLKDGNAGHMWDPAQVGGPPGALPTLLLTTIGRKSGGRTGKILKISQVGLAPVEIKLSIMFNLLLP